MQEKKKILYIITKSNFGGAQRYVFDLAVNLDKEKFEVAVACGENPSKKPGLKEKLSEKGIRIVDLHNSQRNISLIKDIKTFFEIKELIKLENPDIMHLNSSKIGGLGALAGRLCGVKKIIFTGHAWAFNEKRNFLSKIVIFILHWISVLLSHKTILVSEKVKNDIEWMPFIAEKIVVINNGIENFETLNKKEAQEKLSVKAEGKNVIISLSELNDNKGVDIAIKAISLLPKEIKENLIYIIAGTGKEKEALEKLIDELNLGQNISLLGFIDNAKSILKAGDMFLLSSRTEAFPYVILEAGLAGLPIISTSVGGIPEVVKDMENGILVHPNRPKEIAEAISYLLGHKDKKEEFGLKIQKDVIEKFSLEKMLTATSDLYS